MSRLIDADLLLKKLNGYLAPREYDELDEVRNAFVYNCIEEVELAIEKAAENMTIGDKIRQSNESLVEFFGDFVTCRQCVYTAGECDKNCPGGFLGYLNQPAESEEE